MTAEPSDPRRVVALAGGVGGAKLAEGLQGVVHDRLTVIVNTADDTERHGLLVCADHDTVMYTLAGLENAAATPEGLAAIDAAQIVVIAPSNPIVSVAPILAVPRLSEALAAAHSGGTRIAAVSGIIGGRALKGPADRMLASLGHEPT